MTNRELDAAIAEALGRKVIGSALCVSPEGEWSVHAATGTPENWMCAAGIEPVMLCDYPDIDQYRRENYLPVAFARIDEIFSPGRPTTQRRRKRPEYVFTPEDVQALKDKEAEHFVGDWHISALEPVPWFSTDPVAADALMRALRERGWSVTIDVADDCSATIEEVGGVVFETAVADTWTLALAKAALSALTAGRENVDG